jgi:hypothetical protein
MQPPINLRILSAMQPPISLRILLGASVASIGVVGYTVYLLSPLEWVDSFGLVTSVVICFVSLIVGARYILNEAANKVEQRINHSQKA